MINFIAHMKHTHFSENNSKVDEIFDMRRSVACLISKHNNFSTCNNSRKNKIQLGYVQVSACEWSFDVAILGVNLSTCNNL